MHGGDPGALDCLADWIPQFRKRKQMNPGTYLHRGRTRLSAIDISMPWSRLSACSGTGVDGSGKEQRDKRAVIGTHGFYVDVTPAERGRQDMVTARLREIVDSRALIEQAKGMLMFIYDVDDEVAFGVLKWLSQENNIKLRLLAEQICTDLRAVAGDTVPGKAAFDHVLTTVHQRLAVAADPTAP